MGDTVTRPYADPVCSLICDRCSRVFDAAWIMPLCWLCQQAAPLWPRPLSTAEIKAAAKSVRRQHLLHQSPKRQRKAVVR